MRELLTPAVIVLTIVSIIGVAVGGALTIALVQALTKAI
jgi:hypothetical protein